MMTVKYGFIGCGNMGGALAGACADGLYGEMVAVCDADEKKALALCDRYVEIVEYPIEKIASSCAFIVIGVKPQQFDTAAEQIKGLIAGRADRPVIISMMAGRTIASVREKLGDLPVIRIMPNLAASVGEAIIVWDAEGVSDAEAEDFLGMFGKAGKLYRMDESKIDAASAISGCGPAFAFMFVEALADGGVKCGLTRKDAEFLAEQMLLGSAKVLMDGSKNPGVMKDAVCSPGGTTIEGVLELERGGFRGTVSDAVIASYEKNKKL